MRAIFRIVLATLLLALAFTPLGFHFAYAGLYLVRHVGRGFAVLNLVGCVTWLWICWMAWCPAPARVES